MSFFAKFRILRNIQKNNFGDPYSSNMERFLKEIVLHDEKQAHYFNEYQNYPSLRKFFVSNEDASGDFIGFEIPSEQTAEYTQAKQAIPELLTS